MSGDGCSFDCLIEDGYSCVLEGKLSVCTPLCGNGVLDASEGCDDDNTADGDGCSSTCTVEDGYGC